MNGRRHRFFSDGAFPETDRTCSRTTEKKTTDGLIFNGAKLLLAEMRTSLSTLRTGITVWVLSFTVVSFLLATSERSLIQGSTGLIRPIFNSPLFLGYSQCIFN